VFDVVTLSCRRIERAYLLEHLCGDCCLHHNRFSGDGNRYCYTVGAGLGFVGTTRAIACCVYYLEYWAKRV
jgi:hypothetical protein